MLVKINNVDYSNNLVTEYDINNKKEYSDWTDSNGNKHIELKRQSIQGTLKFKFTESQYKKFLQDINDNFNELYDMSQNITYGTSAPSNTMGNNGDIYIQYEN